MLRNLTMKNIDYQDKNSILEYMQYLLNEKGLNPSSLLLKVSDEFRDDEEFMTKAIEIDPMSFIYSSTRLKHNKNLIVKSIKKDNIVHLFIDKKYKRNPEVLSTMVKEKGIFETLIWINRSLPIILFLVMIASEVMLLISGLWHINILLIIISYYRIQNMK